MSLRDPHLNYAEPHPKPVRRRPDWLPRYAIDWDTCRHCGNDIYLFGAGLFEWYHREDGRASCPNQQGREVHDPKQ